MPNSAIIIDEEAGYPISSVLAGMMWNTDVYERNALEGVSFVGLYDLVVLYRLSDRSHEESDEAVFHLRRNIPAFAHLPIVGLALCEGDRRTATVNGADLLLRADSDEAACRAAFAPFGISAPPELERLVQAFGPAAILPLVRGLRDTLIDALATLGHGDTSMAHRIAGSAGIIGLADLGTTWSDYEHGIVSPVTVARRTRRAIAQLTRIACSDKRG